MPATGASTAYSHRAVWGIAAPMILSNLSVPLPGIVDTAMMGHLPDARYLAAVAIGATIFNFLFMGLNFLRMGTTGLAAQAFGGDEPAEVRNVLAQAMLTSAGLAAVLLVLQRPLADAAVWLLNPGPAVAEHARTYFGIRIFAAPAVLANFVLVGWFVGLQHARAALMLMLTINLTNVVLDLYFVLGLGFDVDGVASASLIAEYAGLAVGLLIAARLLKRHGGHWRRVDILDRARFRRLFDVNMNLFVRTLSLMFAFGFFTAQGARQGTLILAANALLLNFQHLLSYGLDGFAHAAEALVGRAMGAGDRDGFRTAVRRCMQWSVGVALLYCVVFAAAGKLCIDALADIADVREAAYTYLPWLVLSPLMSVWSFAYDGIYVGATRAREMRNSMLISAFAVFVPAYYLLEPFGNHGLWLAFMIFMAARGVTMHWLFPAAAERGWRERDAGVGGRC